DFDIPSTDNGYNSNSGIWTIVLFGGALPSISVPMAIDGTSQPGYAGTPVILLDGNGLMADGLDLNATNDTVEGLSITEFGGNGITVNGDGNSIGAAGGGNNIS